MHESVVISGQTERPSTKTSDLSVYLRVIDGYEVIYVPEIIIVTRNRHCVRINPNFQLKCVIKLIYIWEGVVERKSSQIDRIYVQFLVEHVIDGVGLVVQLIGFWGDLALVNQVNGLFLRRL